MVPVTWDSFFPLICLQDSAALLQKRLLMLPGSIFYVNAAHYFLRSWSLWCVLGSRCLNLWYCGQQPLKLVLSKCLQMF